MTDDSLPLAVVQQIDTACDEFENEWKSGNHPRIEDFLANAEAPHAREFLKSLLQVELELLRRDGQPISADSFVARFAEHADLISDVLDSVQASPQKDLGADASRKAPTVSLRDASIDTSQLGKTAIAGKRKSTPEFLGRFEIMEVLGEGAFGTVYRATDPQLHREVALKVPRAGVLETQEDVDRFLQEARAAATLRQPHICPIYDFGKIGDHYFIVMAYIKGQPLSEVLTKSKIISPRKIAAAVRKIALALGEAHKNQVVHRDLKPSNIMIDKRGEPVVMDFGLARKFSGDEAQLTHSGAILGTPAYMPPEQARGQSKEVGPTSDVYSLGVILYELLCGQRPFRGAVAEVLAAILYKDPPPPSSHKPDVDPQLEAICLKAMAKKPEQRYPSMENFAESLTEYLRAQRESGPGAPSDSQEMGAFASMADSGPVPVPKKPRPKHKSKRTKRAAGEFDPYHKWLGISPEEQPANQYRLLGLKPFEDDADVIDAAAERQMSYLHQISAGPHLADSQRLLNELAAARLCLLNEEKKAAYDAQLHDELATSESSIEHVAVSVEGDDDEFATLPMRTQSSSDEPPWWKTLDRRIVAAGGVMFFVLLGIVIFWRSGGVTFRIELSDELLAGGPVTLKTDGEEHEIGLAGLGITLKPGTYAFEVRRGDEIIRGNGEFTVVRGGKNLLTITQEEQGPGGLPPINGHDPFDATPFELLTSEEWEWSEPVEINFDTALPVGFTSLVFDSNRPGGLGKRDLWAYTRKTPTVPWRRPKNLGEPINSSADEASPFLSADGLTMLFESDRPGGSGGSDLWQSTRSSTNAQWSKPVNMGPEVNSSRTDGLSTLSSDGLTLLVASNRPGGYGQADLWFCRRATVTARWSSAFNLGSHVNSNSKELATILSSDGKVLIFASDRPGGHGTADLWMTTQDSPDQPWTTPVNLGAPLNTSQWDAPVALSPDGSTLVFRRISKQGQDSQAYWFSRRVRKEKLPIEPSPEFDNTITKPSEFQRLQDHGQDLSAMAVAFTPDGQKLVTANEDKRLRVWDVQTGRLLDTLDTRTVAQDLAISPDGRYAAWGGVAGFAGIWNIENRELVHNLKTGRRRPATLMGIDYSPDGKLVAACGHDRFARIWDAKTGREIKSFPTKAHKNGGSAIKFTPDGETVLVKAGNAGEEGVVQVFDVQSGELKNEFKLGPNSSGGKGLAISPDGRQFAVGNFHRWTIVFDLETGKKISDGEPGYRDATRVAYSPDSRWIAVGHFGGSVQILDAITLKRKFVLRHEDAKVEGLAFSPDSHYLASATTKRGDKNATGAVDTRIWRLPDAAPLVQEDDALTIDGVASAAVKDESRLNDKDQTLLVYEAARKRLPQYPGWAFHNEHIGAGTAKVQAEVLIHNAKGRARSYWATSLPAPNVALDAIVFMESTVMVVSESNAWTQAGVVLLELGRATEEETSTVRLYGQDDRIFVLDRNDKKIASVMMDTTDAFHTYRVELDGNTLRLFVDGVLKETVASVHILAATRNLQPSSQLFAKFGDDSRQWSESVTHWKRVAVGVIDTPTTEDIPDAPHHFDRRLGEPYEINVPYKFRVTGAGQGKMWGTDVYTSDSQIAVAAVHSGVLKVGETGVVKITLLPGRDSYHGATRNGVTSRSFHKSYPHSYKIEPADGGGTIPTPEPQDGFVSLFNGKNLDGWVGDAAGFMVENGNLVCRASSKGNLYTAREYDDFTLRFEFKLTPEANNGIGLRTPMTGDPAYDGLEVQILDDSAKRYGQITAHSYHGSLYGVAAAKRGHLKPVGQWNTEEIVCNDDQLRVKLNGVTILDTKLDQTGTVITPDGKAHPGLQQRSGHIALLGQKSRVEFRNLQIREGEHITSTAPNNPKSTVEWTDLFNGRDLTGWSASDKDRWSVTDGVLSGTGSKGSRLTTNREFGDYELEFDYRLAKGSRGAVALHAPDNGRSGRTRHLVKVSLVDNDFEFPKRNTTRQPATRSQNGAVYGYAAPDRRAEFPIIDENGKPAGKWNKMAIRSQGFHVTITLNGKQIVNSQIDETDFFRKQTSRSTNARLALLKRVTGAVGFAMTDKTIELRNVRIRELKLTTQKTAKTSATSKSPSNNPHPLQAPGKQISAIKQLVAAELGKGTFGNPPNIEKMQQFAQAEVTRRKQTGLFKATSEVNFTFNAKGQVAGVTFRSGGGGGFGGGGGGSAK